MFDFSTDCTELSADLLDEIKLFYPNTEESDITILHSLKIDGETLINTVSVDGITRVSRDRLDPGFDFWQKKRIVKRTAKLSVYHALVEKTGLQPPWGSLTGIRPSKLVYDMLDEGYSLDESESRMHEIFDVRPDKAKLIAEVVKNQRGYYVRDDSLFNLYIHIPFCTTKCSYCSFATLPLKTGAHMIDDYLSLLRTEIEDALSVVSRHGKLLSVYVGGGTPTALTAEQLHTLLVGFPFRDGEFTVEAGRPDTIDAEKLDALSMLGVNRLCVNPQSLNDRTLERIGRAHTAADFFDKFSLAKKYNFSLNVDLIAGLEGESAADFSATIDAVSSLAPDNITVHTLALKNGSQLKEQGVCDNAAVGDMVDYARSSLCRVGYIPYYLYRQKSMLGNLENVGYTQPNRQCINNITVMEDAVSVLACGAGAITKAVSGERKQITRFAGLRDVKEYIERFDEKRESKRIFCEKQFTN